MGRGNLNLRVVLAVSSMILSAESNYAWFGWSQRSGFAVFCVFVVMIPETTRVSP